MHLARIMRYFVLMTLLLLSWNAVLWLHNIFLNGPPPPRNSTLGDVGVPVALFWQPSTFAVEGNVSEIWQCRALGASAVNALQSYVDAHRRKQHSSRLIYSCEPHHRRGLCGGYGDRLKGIISVFLLAVVTQRRFELFHPLPAPLQRFLPPHLLNWIPSMPAFVTPHAFEELNASMQRIPVKYDLMRLQGHRPFFAWFDRSFALFGDIRLQSNSPGIDSFLYRYAPILSRERERRLGIPQRCNVSCYFGCVYEMLFRSSLALQEKVREIGMVGKAPLLGLQVRAGGSWASGLRVPEPFRTPPIALPHLRAMLSEVVAQIPQIETVFVTSDSPRLIAEVRGWFGGGASRALRLLWVDDNASYHHTDTLLVHRFMPWKFKHVSDELATHSFLATLANHELLSQALVIVMAQSGFGDTAFWRSRGTAFCIFVDMTNFKVAWQFTQSFNDSVEASPAAVQCSRNIRLTTPPIKYLQHCLGV